MKLYKWTDSDGRTRPGESNETQWGEGVEHTAPGGELCTEGVLHAYETAELAVLMRPAHCSVYTILWECEGDVCVTDGTKVGCTRLRTLRQVEPPAVTTAQAVRFGIAAVWQQGDTEWQRWAAGWLDSTDRSVEAAEAAVRCPAAALAAGVVLADASWAAVAATRSAEFAKSAAALAAEELESWAAKSGAASWELRAAELVARAAARKAWTELVARAAARKAASAAELAAQWAECPLPGAALAAWAVSDAGIEDMPGYKEGER